MRYLCVMPWMVREFRDECLANCKLDVFEVDNSEKNRGIMVSHNYGIDRMYHADADWLIIMSAAVRFGPSGGLDLIEALEHLPDADVVNVVGLFGWHMMAFSRRVIETCGRWDENFTPYGLDDNDYSIRIHKALPQAVWWGLTGLEIADTMMAHSIKVGGLYAPYAPIHAYFVRKWGYDVGHQFDEYHDHPFNDPANPIWYWPETPVGGKCDPYL